LTTGGTGETNSAAGPSRYRPRDMWRMSSGQALIFIAVVVVMVALAVLLLA
jgi:hypothetical protein